MLGRSSVGVKLGLVFVVSLLLAGTGLFFGVAKLKTRVLRNEAMTVASQVISFRSWVNGSDMIWVDNLGGDSHDYLVKRESGRQVLYGKNHALATREISAVFNKMGGRAAFRFISDDVRQPTNAPDEFEKAVIRRFKEGRANTFAEGYEGNVYRYAQPVFVTESCLRCHGDPNQAPPEVIERYGSDKAFHYKVGDVRGIISVSLQDIGSQEVLAALANPASIGLVLLALLLSTVFTHRAVTVRLRKLTARTEEIVGGNHDADLAAPEDSGDEIDKVYGAVHLLRNSLKVAIRRLEKKD